MRPQYFPWLFDDKSAWEKSLADSRYSYDLPMDHFMSIYSVERKFHGGAPQSLPAYLPPTMAQVPIMPSAAAPASSAVFAAPAAPAAAAPAKGESKIEEGILSQEEIDALLSGL